MPQLNAEQREAVCHLDGPLLVLAGAGSGKTRVIAHKIAHLVGRAGFEARRIAAVTFTNKAAREMRRRCAELLGPDLAAAVGVSTFHSLGLRILRADLAHIGRRREFTIYDEADGIALVNEILRAESKLPAVDAADIHARISRLKADGHAPGPALAQARDRNEIIAAAAFERYQAALAAYNAVDLDDLIALPVRLFREHPDVLAAWQERIRYLLIDEYQDTNLAQYELVRLLTGARGALTVVGDDDQSIYGWRGAHPENLARLARDYPGLTVVKLEQNYRSAGNILAAANALIANNPHVFPKRLWSDRGRGGPLRVVVTQDADEEAIDVAGRILAQRLETGARWSDFAILYRGNHQARPFERALRERNVPYAVSGGPSFFDFTEVKDVMAYLRLLVNPDDDAAFLRIVNTPRRELGATTISALAARARAAGLPLFSAIFDAGLEATIGARALDRLRAFGRWLGELGERARGDAPVAVVTELIDGCGYRDWVREVSPDPATAARRLGNLDDLLDWLRRLALGAANDAEGTPLLGSLVAQLTLTDRLERDAGDENADGVRLMTLHSAKGLEFPHVFLVGMEERLLPHHASIDAGTVAEERRLAYVGITRAQSSLTFVLARRRRRFGEDGTCLPSRFLKELPGDLLAWHGDAGGAGPDPSRARATLAGLRQHLTRG